jgi:hypothetical protein
VVLTIRDYLIVNPILGYGTMGALSLWSFSSTAAAAGDRVLLCESTMILLCSTNGHSER